MWSWTIMRVNRSFEVSHLEHLTCRHDGQTTMQSCCSWLTDDSPNRRFRTASSAVAFGRVLPAKQLRECVICTDLWPWRRIHYTLRNEIRLASQYAEFLSCPISERCLSEAWLSQKWQLQRVCNKGGPWQEGWSSFVGSNRASKRGIFVREVE